MCCGTCRCRLVFAEIDRPAAGPSVIEKALRLQRTRQIAPRIARGALETEVAAKLQTDANRSYVPELERRLLADDLVLLPEHSVEPKRGSRGNLTRLEGVQACYFTSAAAFDPERTFASCSRGLRTRFFSSSTWAETSLMRNVHVGGKVGVILVIAVLALVVRYLKVLEQTSEFSAARRAYVQAHPEAAGARFAICYSCGFRSRYLAN